MEMEYIQAGDYQIPNLRTEKEPEGDLFKWGLMRLNYLRENRRGVYASMLLRGKLKEHCLKIQTQAEEMMENLTKQMMQSENVTEELKMTDQLSWVAKMNSIRNRAEEIVRSDLINTL